MTGVGASKNAAPVKRRVTIRIVWVWLLTIPTSALCAGIVYQICLLFIKMP